MKSRKEGTNHQWLWHDPRKIPFIDTSRHVIDQESRARHRKLLADALVSQEFVARCGLSPIKRREGGTARTERPMAEAQSSQDSVLVTDAQYERNHDRFFKGSAFYAGQGASNGRWR